MIVVVSEVVPKLLGGPFAFFPIPSPHLCTSVGQSPRRCAPISHNTHTPPPPALCADLWPEGSQRDVSKLERRRGSVERKEEVKKREVGSEAAAGMGGIEKGSP